MTANPRVWAVVPAAGIGRRMHAGRPKQYLHVGGRPLIEWTLERILAPAYVAGAVVAIAPDDPYWPALSYDSAKPVITVPGGSERFESVTCALRRLAAMEGNDVWALVHDAVRPCVTQQELNRLVGAIEPDRADGALLAVPVRDTLKRADEAGRVVETLPRGGLWQALTPQLFPVQALLPALDAVLDGHGHVTDEAQAMERAGYAPALVPGSATNVKLTHPEDLSLISLLVEAC